jgi:hypothetical protein
MRKKPKADNPSKEGINSGEAHIPYQLQLGADEAGTITPEETSATGKAAESVVAGADFPRTIEEAKERASQFVDEAGHELGAALRKPAMDLLAHYFGMGKAIVEGAIDGAAKAKHRRGE